MWHLGEMPLQATGQQMWKMQGRPSLQVSEGPTALLTPEPRTSGLQNCQTARPRGFPGVPYFLPASPVTPCTAGLSKAGLNLRNLRRAELPPGPPEVSVDPHFSPAPRRDRISIRESRVGCGCRGPQGTPSPLQRRRNVPEAFYPGDSRHVCAGAHTCAHTHVCARACACTHPHMCAHSHMRTHMYMHGHTCVRTQAHTLTHVHAHTHVCTLTHVCAHTYMHTYTRSHSSEKGVRPHTGCGGRLVH